MATQDCSNSSGVLWERAKELLKREDYERLKIVIKTFSKTRSVEGLCSDLLKIVNSRSKVDILVEVRRCLPQNQRNTFTRHCNELIGAEAEREGEDFWKKRKIEAKEIKRENTAPNFQGSPAKKTKPDREKARNSRTETRLLQGNNKLGPGWSKESTSLGFEARQAVPPDVHGSHQENKVIVIERKSMSQGFGLRIRGGTFHHPSITVAQVAKNSLADRQGLKTGDRIIRVNDQRCGRDVDIAQVIGIIKASKTLRMRIISSEAVSKNECKVQGFVEAKGYEQVAREEKRRLPTVSVYPDPDEDGWLGCCIRGGADYACDVHVISVNNDSPAERAGLKAGDVIVKVNGISTKDLTHVQVVRLVVISGSCITFSVRPGKKQNKPLRQELVRVRPTPLRTQRNGPHLVTPPGSPTSRGFHLPGYQQKHCGTVVDSPSQLPLDVLNLDCMPPPPYTPEVPLRHRVLARGEEGHDVREEQEQQCIHFLREPQLNQEQQKPQGNQDQQEPRDTHPQLEPLGAPQPQPLNMSYQQQQMNDGNEASFDGNIENIPQGCSVMEPDCALCPILIPEEVEMSSVEKEALINETAREMSTTLHPATVSSNSLPSTSPSPVQSNGRESFLSQIRQFNKAKLKKLALHPEDNSNQLHFISSERNHNPDDQMQRTEDEKDSPQVGNTQENAGSMDLLSALNQAMKHRARVLHDTLSSVDEGNSSDDDDDEWEL